MPRLRFKSLFCFRYRAIKSLQDQGETGGKVRDFTRHQSSRLIPGKKTSCRQAAGDLVPYGREEFQIGAADAADVGQ